MQRRLVRGAAVLVAVWFASRSQPSFAASTDSEPLDLEWIAPSGCPSRAKVLDDIARILDRPRTESPLARVAARAAPFRGEDGRWHVVLTISGDAAGERTLDASSCEELSNAAELVLALRVDPALLAPEKQPAAPPESLASVACAVRGRGLRPSPNTVSPPLSSRPTPSVHKRKVAGRAILDAHPVAQRHSARSPPRGRCRRDAVGRRRSGGLGGLLEARSAAPGGVLRGSGRCNKLMLPQGRGRP